MVLSFASPANSANVEFAVYQKTLATFKVGSTNLSAAQKTQVKNAVTANPGAEKFICTGIRLETSSRTESTRIRSRAKAACDYAKILNPQLSIFVQSKTTTSRSFLGKVLLTVKSPKVPSGAGEVGGKTEVVADSNALAPCQLKENRNLLGLDAKGFRPVTTFIPSTGKVKMLIIPIDFSDVPGDKDLFQRLEGAKEKIEAWGPDISLGKLEYEVEMPTAGWIRAPKPSSYYKCAKCGQTEMQSMDLAIAELIKTADPHYDFTGVQMIHFFFPRASDSKVYGAVYSPVTTNEGPVSPSVFYYNDYPDWATLWDWIVHETLHPQGFIHGPLNGGPFSIMQGGWGPVDGVEMWQGFVKGWYGENEILCLEAKDLPVGGRDITLNSMDNFGDGYESVMVKLNEEELIVIEWRTPGKYNHRGKSEMTAYRVNVNGKNVLCEPGWGCDPDQAEKDNWWGYIRENGSLTITNSVAFGGVRITVKGPGTISLTKD